jgi:hypothetical protein
MIGDIAAQRAFNDGACRRLWQCQLCLRQAKQSVSGAIARSNRFGSLSAPAFEAGAVHWPGSWTMIRCLPSG